MSEELTIIPAEYVLEDGLDWLRLLRKMEEEDEQVEKESLKVLFYDCKLALDHALALGKKFKVFHFTEWRYAYPRLEDYMIGYGFDELEKVRDVGSVLDVVDFVVFSDVGYGDFADYLRKGGKNVFGASVKGELLELDRLYMADVFNRLGIKTPEYRVAYGVDKLRELVPEFSDGRYFVKLNIFRGNMETFSVLVRESLDTYLDNANFGIFRDDIVFLVSKEIEGVEIGVDCFFNGREFLRPYFWGNEVKGSGSTFGKWVKESIWDSVLEKVEPFLAETGYRGSISFEAIFDGSDLHVLDVTARLPYPGGSLLHYSLDNYAEVVEAVSRGEYVDPEPVDEYFAQLPLLRDDKNWVGIDDYDEGGTFFPRYAVKSKDTGKIWLLPADESLAGVVCGKGGVLSEAVNNAVKSGLALKSRGVSLGTEGIFKYESYLTELRERGLEW